MIRRNKLSGSTFIAAVAIVFAACGLVVAQEQPWDPNVSPLGPSTGFVNDYAGVIDVATKQQLEDKLTAFKQKTTVEIAVCSRPYDRRPRYFRLFFGSSARLEDRLEK
jgi:hypothetical protein